jgi:hypothetical protein
MLRLNPIPNTGGAADEFSLQQYETHQKAGQFIFNIIFM